MAAGIPALSYDAAIELAVDAFASAHPESTLPSWFATSAFRQESVTSDGKVEVRFYAEPATPLLPSQSWVETDHGMAIQEIDLKSGEKTVIITRDTSTMLTLFRVVVDPKTGDCFVVESMDFESIGSEKIEHPRRRNNSHN